MRRHGESGVRPGGKADVRKAWGELWKIQRDCSWACLCTHLLTHCPWFLPREPVAGLPSPAGPSAALNVRTTDSATEPPWPSAPRAAPRNRAVLPAPWTALPKRQKPFQHRQQGLRSPRLWRLYLCNFPGFPLRAPGAPLRGWELGPFRPGSLPFLSLALGTLSRLSIHTQN